MECISGIVTEPLDSITTRALDQRNYECWRDTLYDRLGYLGDGHGSTLVARLGGVVPYLGNCDRKMQLEATHHDASNCQSTSKSLGHTLATAWSWGLTHVRTPIHK